MRIIFPLTCCVLLCASSCDAPVPGGLADGNAWTDLEDRLDPFFGQSDFIGDTRPAAGTLRARDVNGDGLSDLLGASLLALSHVPAGQGSAVSESVLSFVGINIGSAANDSTEPSIPVFYWLVVPGFVTARDLDGDGVAELFAVNPAEAKITIYDYDLSGGATQLVERLEAQNLSTSGVPPVRREVSIPCLESTFKLQHEGDWWLQISQANLLADLNVDGILDLICSREDGSELLLGNTDGFAPASPLKAEALDAVADVDGDGILDGIASEELPSPASDVAPSQRYLVHHGRGDGTFEAATPLFDAIEGGLGRPGHFLDLTSFGPLTADFDCDGLTDFVVYQRQQAETPLPTAVAIYLSSNDAQSRSYRPVDTNLSLNWHDNVVDIGDLDGDGCSEIVVVGHDVDFESELGSFVRVIKYKAGRPEVVSNTSLGMEGYWTDVKFDVVVGDFLGVGSDQVLTLGDNTFATFYRWDGASYSIEATASQP